MSDTKSDFVKPARSTGSRGKAKAKADAPATDEIRPASAEDEGFAAGIVDETPATPPAEPDAPSAPAATTAGPPPQSGVAHQPPARIDPNEHGFDAETNSRYEEIKKGNTY